MLIDRNLKTVQKVGMSVFGVPDQQVRGRTMPVNPIKRGGRTVYVIDQPPKVGMAVRLDKAPFDGRHCRPDIEVSKDIGAVGFGRERFGEKV